MRACREWRCLVARRHGFHGPRAAIRGGVALLLAIGAVAAGAQAALALPAPPDAPGAQTTYEVTIGAGPLLHAIPLDGQPGWVRARMTGKDYVDLRDLKAGDGADRRRACYR